MIYRFTPSGGENGAGPLRSILFFASCLFLIWAGYSYLPQTLETLKTNSQARRLPIYCVQTDEPKVALSFDAAWESA